MINCAIERLLTMGNLGSMSDLARNWDSIYKWVMELENEGIVTGDVKSAFGDPLAQDKLPMLLPLEPALEVQKTSNTGINAIAAI